MQFKSTQNNFKKSTFKVLPFVLNLKSFIGVVHASQIREQFYVSVAWNDFECVLGGSMVLICYRNEEEMAEVDKNVHNAQKLG